MKKFHIGKNGKVSECNAKDGNCPLGADNHFDTKEEAERVSQEREMELFLKRNKKFVESGNWNNSYHKNEWYTRLLGAKLIDYDGYSFTVDRGGEIYKIEIEEEQGDCCGFAEATAELLIDPKDLKNRPVITNVSLEDYEDDKYSSYCYGGMTITLLGLNKKLYQISAVAGSDFGYDYGQAVTVLAKKITKEGEESGTNLLRDADTQIV